MKTNTIYRVAFPFIPKEVPVSTLPSLYAGNIAAMVSQGLFEYGEGGALVPSLARTFRIKEGKFLEIELLDRTFHDQTRVTSSEVLRSIHRCLKERRPIQNGVFRHINGIDSFIAGETNAIDGITTPSENTIVFEMNKSVGLLTHELTQRICNVVKTTDGDSDDLLKGAIATGPYKVSDFSDSHIAFKRIHPGPMPDHVEFRKSSSENILDLAKKYDHFVTGEKADLPGFNRYPYQQLGSHQLVFNNRSAPFNRKTVRKAVSMAIDKAELAKVTGWPESRLQDGLVPYGMRGFRQTQTRVIDKQKILRLLKSVGYDQNNPLKFQILIRDNPLYIKEKLFWESIFSSYPIKVTVVLVNTNELLEKAKTGDYDAVRIGKDPGSHEPYRLFESYLKDSPWNTPGSDTPQCEKIIQAVFHTVDPQERHALYEKADKCLIEENAILAPLSSFSESFVYVRKPWRINRQGRFLLYPYRIHEIVSEK